MLSFFFQPNSLRFTEQKNETSNSSNMATETQIDVDATQFALSSLSLLNAARQKKSHCDFIIKVGNLEIPVHKNILSIRSEYFEIMFGADTKESKDGYVVMKNADQECVVKCIDFIYTGKASIVHEKIGCFLHVAHLMGLHDLCNGIVKLLIGALNYKSFFETKRLANTYNLEDLEKICDDFAKQNFEAISKEKAFEKLEKNYIRFRLKAPNTMGTDTIKLDALLKWIHGELSERNQTFHEMLHHICLTKIPPRYYQRLLQKEPLVYESASVLRKFTLCMMKATVIRDDALVLYDSSAQAFHVHWVSAIPPSETKLMSAPKKLGRANFSIVQCNDKFYLITSRGALYSIECDDPIETKWKDLKSMNKSLSQPLAVAMNDYIYVIGSDETGLVGERYNITSDKWYPIPTHTATNYNPLYYQQNNQVRIPRTDSSIIAVQGIIYLVGGMISEQIQENHNHDDNQNQPITHGLSNVEIFNTSASQWHSPVFMNNPRYGAGVAAKGASIYVIGGQFSGQKPSPAVEYYDTAGSSERSRWINLNNQLSIQGLVSACVISGRIYVVGNSRETVEEFNLDTSVWSTLGLQGPQRQWSDSVAMCVKTLV